MAAPATRGSLKTRALQRADCLNQGFIDQSPGGELEQMIDTEMSKLWDLLSSINEGYTEKGPIYLNTVAYQRQYLLPSDFYKLVACYYVPQNQPQSGYKFPLRQYTNAEYGSRGNYYNWGPPPIYYKVDGQRGILFDPPPSQNQSSVVEIWYIPVFTPPASDTERVTNFILPGWEDYVIDGVAANIRIKEETDSTILLQRQQTFSDGLRANAATRDLFQPKRINDTGWKESGYDDTYGLGFWGYYGVW